MDRISLALIAFTLVTVAVAEPAAAHQKGAVLESPTGERLYLFTDHGATSIWEESNGKTDHGTWANAEGTNDMGLQMHNVCYGSFTQADVDAWNADMAGYHVLSYLPFDGTVDDCAQLGGTSVEPDSLIAGDVRDYGHE